MKRKAEEEERDEFIVLFTALSMILLAFFIMLNSMAVIDESRSRKALDSLVGTFGMMPGYEASERGAFNEESRGESKRQRLKTLLKSLRAFEDTSAPGMNVRIRQDGSPVVELGAQVLFETGGQHINPKAYDALDRIAAMIRRARYPVKIEGHSDLRPAGAANSNWYLSTARAAAVHRYFERAARVPPGWLTAVGMGATRPAPDAASAQDPRHRRVEIVFQVGRDVPEDGGASE
ncbi:MAG: OmpA family protein [Myxococcota bacterium]